MIKIIFNAAHMKTTNNMIKSYLTILMIFASIFILEGCSSQKNSIYWVNSMKNNCTNGAGQMQCLMIHKGDSMDTPQWELFYTEIEGFICSALPLRFLEKVIRFPKCFSISKTWRDSTIEIFSGLLSRIRQLFHN